MTVFRRARTGGKSDIYSYDFWVHGERYRGSTGQIAKDAAKQWERREQDKIRRLRAGLHADASATPTFQDWAEEAYEIHARRVSRPDRVEFLIRSILKFWGRVPKPSDGIPIDQTAPYHDLYLGDVITEPYWLERFEQWMASRALSAQTKNHYRSMLSVLFKIACEPAQRERTGLVTNPVSGIHRDKTTGKKVTLTADEIRRWLAVAPDHLKRAVTIGALAPALRLQNILSLEWKPHVDLDARQITVWNHKTARKTKAPIIAAISPQLHRILTAWRRLDPNSTHVITYRKKPIKRYVHETVKKTLQAAGLPAGRADGATFHTLRHSAATELVRRHVGMAHVQKAMGHADIQTSMRYTHLVTDDVRAAAGELDKAYALEDLVVGTSAHPPQGTVGKPRRTGRETARHSKTEGHTRVIARALKPHRTKKFA